MKPIQKFIWCKGCQKRSPHILASYGLNKTKVKVAGRCLKCGILREFRFSYKFWVRIVNNFRHKSASS